MEHFIEHVLREQHASVDKYGGRLQILIHEPDKLLFIRDRKLYEINVVPLLGSKDYGRKHAGGAQDS